MTKLCSAALFTQILMRNFSSGNELGNGKSNNEIFHICEINSKGSFNNYVTLLAESLDVPTYVVPCINDKIMLCSLVYPNLDDTISLKGSENEVGNGESTNQISHISNLRYVIIEQTLTS